MFCSSVDVVSKINWKLEEGDVAAIPVWGVENIAFRVERAQEKVPSLGRKDKSGACGVLDGSQALGQTVR